MPFITVTYPPKYPLTESEKKWLKERELDCLEYGGYFCSHCEHFTGEYDPWTGYCDVAVAQCPIESPDWKDCAEFEARLNKRLIEGEEIDKPCSHFPKPMGCPYPKKLLEPGEDISPHCPFTKKWNTPCEWCDLKELRLLVEEEMEKEKKK